MSLQKEMAKAFTARAAHKHLQPFWYEKPDAEVPNPAKKLMIQYVRPIWFRFFKGPWERWEYNNLVRRLRDSGICMDDCYDDRDVLWERAVDLLPHDLAVSRYRRMMRGSELFTKRKHMPEDQLNYDPMIPYMAPYVEEAKFMLQEELELAGYHSWDRSLFKSGVTGFGDRDANSTNFSWMW